MSESILDYTNTDAVRSQLGASAKELEDDILLAQGLEMQLRLDLDAWVPTHEAIYVAGEATGATADEIRQHDLLMMYSQFYVSALVADSAPGWMLQSIADGKIEASRFSAADMAALAVTLRSKASAFQRLLSDAVNSTSTTNTYTHFGKSTPDYNPVTGPVT